ncbi:MAG TPA: bifunctional riboflavin kinase/FAD synthetase [Verrucomicrobiales bacterium]|nr:bifunctional riboflavin kinase/FAD synthetase [Verrucomicrobiales bacterium]
MHVLHDIAEMSVLAGPLHLAIGVFDGVHLGHRAVIGAALEAARREGGSGLVVTFDPHPARVLAPERAPRLLTTTRHKLRVLERLGVPETLVIRFDRAFAALTGEKFIGLLLANAPGIASVSVGENWAFGRNRRGSVPLLRRLGAEHGFFVSAVGEVMLDSAVVSSTEVRRAVQAGDFARAGLLLGRPYTVWGTVAPGDGLGRTLGVPTANLEVACEQLPPSGVYAVRVECQGRGYKGVANLGYRPSLGREDQERRLEVHVFDFSGDLYGQEIEVDFYRFLRPEHRFASFVELRAQIARDIEEARAVLGEEGAGPAAPATASAQDRPVSPWSMSLRQANLLRRKSRRGVRRSRRG